MDLLIETISETPNSTLSSLSINGKFHSFIIEDGYRENKISGLTRIPGGCYRIVPRRAGGFYNRYRKMYNHDFVPLVEGVPGFSLILFHQGNSVDDTRGCLLPNMGCHLDKNTNLWEGQGSAQAYRPLIAAMAPVFGQGNDIWLHIDRI